MSLLRRFLAGLNNNVLFCIYICKCRFFLDIVPSETLVCLRVVQVVVNGDENSVVLRFLNSLTEYQITVFAIYSNSASEALRGIETTCECRIYTSHLIYRPFC